MFAQSLLIELLPCILANRTVEDNSIQTPSMSMDSSCIHELKN